MGTIDVFNDIRARFDIFDDSMDKYAYLIELGKKTSGISQDERSDSNKIHGCASDSWLIINRDSDGTYQVKTDSEAFIVRGLLSILKEVANGKTNDELQKLISVSFLDEVGLSETISSQRTNGFMNAIDLVKSRIDRDR